MPTNNFDLKSYEELVEIYSNIKVEANENKFILTLFLTNNRLVLLKDVSEELEFNAFLASNLVDIPENLKVVFDINLNEIKEIKYENGINFITFKENNNELKVYCDSLINLIK